MPALHINLQVGQCPHELLVEPADSIGSAIVFVPGLIVILRGIAKSAEDALEIMSVLEANVLIDDCNAGQLPVRGNRSGCHVHPRCGWDCQCGLVIREDYTPLFFVLAFSHGRARCNNNEEHRIDGLIKHTFSNDEAA